MKHKMTTKRNTVHTKTQNMIKRHKMITKRHRNTAKTHRNNYKETQDDHRDSLSVRGSCCSDRDGGDFTCPFTGTCRNAVFEPLIVTLAETHISFSFPLFAAPVCELWIHINTESHTGTPEHGAGVGAVPLRVHSKGWSPRLHRA